MSNDPLPATLRQLSVFVLEVKPEMFRWQVREAVDSFAAWCTVMSSEQEYSSWIDAYDAGDDALIAMVPNLYRGPRQIGSEKAAQSRAMESAGS